MSKAPVFEYHTQVSRIPLKLPNGEEKFVEINPGWAFGTGNHVTTRLCIKVLESLFKERRVEEVLDVGCGSGVLAICAVVLGANKALAVDIESTSVWEAKVNVEKNGFSSDIQVLCGSSDVANGEFDLIVANILADAILSIDEELKSKLKPDGLLLVSGIHEARKGEIVDRFRGLGLYIEIELSEDGWVALLFK
jgi:ribosomal protein L11 methyltransferase